jgi:hypothetical protein
MSRTMRTSSSPAEVLWSSRRTDRNLDVAASPRARPHVPATPRGQEWEMTRYCAYQAQLVRHTIGCTLSLAAAFLRRASRRSLIRL